MTVLTGSPPRSRARTRARLLREPLLGLAGVAAATVALHVRDPHVTHSWGVCPLYAVTGVYCPGCGALRAVNDLTDGHLGQAASSNLLLVVLIPVAAVLFGRWALAAWQGRPASAVPPLSKPVQVAALSLVLVFTLARNWPGSWLAP